MSNLVTMRLLRVCLGLGVTAAIGVAAPILDQDNWFTYNAFQQHTASIGAGPCCGIHFDVAQTFTAGMSGFLDSVDLQITTPESVDFRATAPLSLSIVGTSSTGVPQLSQLLGQVAVTAGSDLATARVIADFAPLNIELVSGQVYGIVAVLPTEVNGTPVSGNYDWYGGSVDTNSYAGGDSFFRNPTAGISSFTSYSGFGPASDLGFQTYMVNPNDAAPVPEPSTAVLVCLASALVIWRRPRRIFPR